MYQPRHVRCYRFGVNLLTLSFKIVNECVKNPEYPVKDTVLKIDWTEINDLKNEMVLWRDSIDKKKGLSKTKTYSQLLHIIETLDNILNIDWNIFKEKDSKNLALIYRKELQEVGRQLQFLEFPKAFERSIAS